VVADDLVSAVSALRGHPSFSPQIVVDVAANYTAFQEFVDQLGGPG